MSRLDDLRELRDDLRTRMAECRSDQNFAVMGRLLIDTVKQIEELDPASRPVPEKAGGVLVDFQTRLANRTGAGA